MATHSWKRQRTQHWGEVWFPYADVQLRTRAGRLQRFAFLVDSGAVTSLLRRSAAETLGIDLDTGKRINLSGVGGGETTAYVHDVETHFDEKIALRVPFAIADSERVPNLLGRREVFDQLQIHFDPSLRKTRITTGWLTEDERQIWEHLNETNGHIYQDLRSRDRTSVVDRVVLQFLARGEKLLRSVAALVQHDEPHGGLLFVRAFFELAAQFEYLMQDPTSRAQDFVDYGHITRYRNIKAILKNPTGSIERAIANDPRRSNVEPQLRAEYDRVLTKFKKPKKGLWNNWYCMTVKDLAGKVGMDAEYRLFYTARSNWVHSDPFSFGTEAIASSDSVRNLSLHYYCVLLLRVADAMKVVLTNDQYQSLRAYRDAFNK